MSTYSLIEVFVMIFVTMAPINALLTFGEKTSEQDAELRAAVVTPRLSPRPAVAARERQRPKRFSSHYRGDCFAISDGSQ